MSNILGDNFLPLVGKFGPSLPEGNTTQHKSYCASSDTYTESPNTTIVYILPPCQHFVSFLRLFYYLRTSFALFLYLEMYKTVIMSNQFNKQELL